MNRDETLHTELGEALFENEPQLALQIAEAIATKIQQGPRPALRDAHPKGMVVLWPSFVSRMICRNI